MKGLFHFCIYVQEIRELKIPTRRTNPIYHKFQRSITDDFIWRVKLKILIIIIISKLKKHYYYYQIKTINIFIKD